MLIANGVNLDLLGSREKEHYGTFNLKELEKTLLNRAKKLKIFFALSKLNLIFYQTNNEEKYLDILQKTDINGFILNPGAWTHTSIALADRLVALDILYTEVHISNIYAREEFRKESLISKSAIGVCSGFGIDSYELALYSLCLKLTSE